MSPPPSDPTDDPGRPVRAVRHLSGRNRRGLPPPWVRSARPAAGGVRGPAGPPTRRIGPIAGLDGESAAAALLGELAERQNSPAVVVVPGTSPELVVAALGAGLKIVGPPALLLLSQPAAPPRALAISGYSLF